MDHPASAQIQALVEPVLVGLRLELVELTTRRQGGQWLVRCFVDAVGGVTLQQCASANRRIGNALEEAALFTDSYTVEVSSPGLDRPLVSQRDYERAIGQQVQMYRQDAQGRAETLRGRLLAVRPDAVVLQQDGENVTVALADVRKARRTIAFR